MTFSYLRKISIETFSYLVNKSKRSLKLCTHVTLTHRPTWAVRDCILYQLFRAHPICQPTRMRNALYMTAVNYQQSHRNQTGFCSIPFVSSMPEGIFLCSLNLIRISNSLQPRKGKMETAEEFTIDCKWHLLGKGTKKTEVKCYNFL